MKEISLKQWRFEEAQRLGISEPAVRSRIAVGKYADMPLRYVNCRVIFVPVDYQRTSYDRPQPGEVTLQTFYEQEMERLGLPSTAAIRMRLRRGWYKNTVTIRRVNRAVVFIKRRPQR